MSLGNTETVGAVHKRSAGGEGAGSLRSPTGRGPATAALHAAKAFLVAPGYKETHGRSRVAQKKDWCVQLYIYSRFGLYSLLLGNIIWMADPYSKSLPGHPLPDMISA